MAANRIRARLLLKSEKFNPEELARFVGLKPDSIGRAGEPLGAQGGPNRKHSSAYFSTATVDEDLTGRMLCHLVAELVDRVEPGSSSWVQQVRASAIEATVIGEVWVEADYSPAVELGERTIGRLAGLGAGFALDFYWWPRSPS